MLSSTQDASYFERMAAALGDKRRLVPLLSGSRILDVGAGGGELAEAMRGPERQVWALDGSHAATRRITARFPEVSVLTGLAHEISYLAPPESFSTIVCSSVLHEVYSYGTPETGPYSLAALTLTLRALLEALEPGGRLLIRDGVMPTDWQRPVHMTLTSADGLQFWARYRSVAPFATWSGEQRTVALSPVEGSPLTLAGNLGAAMEFLYTYTWGWSSAEREMKELYGIFTEEAYRAFVEAHGLVVERSEQYLQPEYAEHLAPLVTLTTPTGAPLPWPSSNFLLSARKPGREGSRHE